MNWSIVSAQFMIIAVGACLLVIADDFDLSVGSMIGFAVCQVMEFGSAGTDRGLLKEFEAIIAVVIGGALLTGGCGSVLGALIFGVARQGLFLAGVQSSLFRVFLGVILLGAVILNTYIRRIIAGER